MMEKLVLIVPVELKITGSVIELIRSDTKFEVTWSVLIYVHFNYPGFSYDGCLSKFSWVVGFIIYIHQYL